MLYKVVKPSGKDVEERDSLTHKKKPKVVNGDKKTRAKPSGEPPASLGAFNYFGRSIDDPQVKLKLLEIGPKTPEQERAEGVEQLVRHMNSVLGDKKYSFRNENHEGNVSGSVKNVDKHKNKSYEKVARSSDAFVNKNPVEKTKMQKTDCSRKPLGLKSKSYISESPERNTDRKILSTTPERKKNCDSQVRAPYGKRRDSPERKRVECAKKEISKSQSAVEPMNKKSSRRSEIPLLKSRQTWEKKTEVVSLLMQKPLQENDSTSSIDCSSNMKDPPVNEFNGAPELEIILKADDNSSQPNDIGGVTNLEGKPQTAENLFTCSNNSNGPLNPKISELTIGEKKTVKASKAKTLDLERVKTSSFTVLRAEGDSLNRLETFHKQNITAKETARAEIAIKASKIMLMTSKTSFSSINQKKTFPSQGGDKGNKSNLKKTKKNKNESQETVLPKKSPKTLETPHLDICKEIIATGKVGCLIPKRVTDEKKNKCVSSEDKSPLRSPVECRGKSEKKTMNRRPVKEKEQSKKNKVHKNVEETPRISSPPVVEESKFVDLSEDDGESSEVRTSETFIIESPARDVDVIQEIEVEEVMEEEVKLTPRELASLVVTGTALNFDDIEVYEKRPEVNKIKLEIKIDVPSEEDVTDSDAVECESSGNVSGASFDWLLMSKMQNGEKQHHELPRREDKTSKEKLTSWHLPAEEVKPGEWQNNETVLQEAHQSLSPIQKRPHFTKKVLNINGMEKKRGLESEDRWSFSGDPYKCSMFFQKENKQDTGTYTKVRSGLTRASNRDEKIFDDPTSLKLRRRNSEPYSLRGFIWKRADVTSPKSLKPSVSSVASSLRHLNTDDMDDFIFWEAVPQKLTSCWEMSLYHFKRPWSVLSFSVFKDNRRSNTPGLILETLRSGGVTNMRRPILYQNDRVSRRKGNIFDVEPSISQKNIDIRNWLAALNFTTPITNATDVITESIISVPPPLDTQKQTNPRRRNVMPQFRLPEKVPEKKLCEKVKNHKFDKWSINDMHDLKELIRKESGSYVTKEQYMLSEISNIRSPAIANACTYTSASEKTISKESEDENAKREGRLVKSVETSCQSEPQEEAFAGQEQLKLKETPDSSSASLKSEMANLPPEVNIWKYLFLFTLIFIIFHYSLGSNFAIRS